LDNFISAMEKLSLKHHSHSPHKHHKRHRLKLDVYSLGLRRAAKQRDVDLGPSERFVEVRDEGELVPALGVLQVEVLQAGGWASKGVGDVFSAEDVYVLLTVDGRVARTNTRNDARAPIWGREERRAFEIEVRDPCATLCVAVLDEDDAPLESDGFIGRATMAVRALRPQTQSRAARGPRRAPRETRVRLSMPSARLASPRAPSRDVGRDDALAGTTFGCRCGGPGASWSRTPSTRACAWPTRT